ncbi:MAG: hypothetical protein HC836_22830 [Richelia sp. RM2_1_2]|nr:hypothetical protein [Richelia sp. RM2_1_2]
MIKKTKIKKVEKLPNFQNEYVYDIGMRGPNPYFFANNILVHNSCYFSAIEMLKANPDIYNGWTRENTIDLYDSIGDEVNKTFPNFMKASFNVPEDKSVIAAGRELIAARGLFIKKKRYAVLIYDLEGWRADLVPEEEAIKKKLIPGFGKVKAMGLDTKRTDTPKPIQDFLTKILELILQGKTEDEVLNFISEFREEFKTWPAYLKGRPMGANNMTLYTECYNNPNKLVDGKKPTIPGHIRAAIHWNLLRKSVGDNYALEIQDGYKVIVCKLKPNNMKWDSIAYPVDELQLPTWFTSLPFDSSGMEDKIIDQKLENLIGVLKWDLSSTRQSSTFNNIFTLKPKKK